MLTKTSRFFAILLVALTTLAASQAAFAQGDDKEEGHSMLSGPSVHLALGIRSKKAPDLDTYYSTVGGIKLSLMNLQAGNAMYFSLIAPGLHYAGYGVFAPSLTPVIFNMNFGLGFAFDLFPVRKDRNGGPLGMSVNLDVIRLMNYLQNR